MQGTRIRGQIRSESPSNTGADPGGSPPRTAGTTLMALPSFAVDPGGERLRHLSCEDCSETAPLPGPGEGPTPRRVSSREDWSISTTPCLPDPPSMRVATEGAGVLGVGIDWAEEFHDVALGTVAKGVTDQFRIEHSPAGVARLIERCLALEPDPAEVRVVLETRHGLLVEALLDAGFSVVPVNPDLVARRRGPARKKDDAEDARICCLLALDRHAGLRTLIPHGQWGGELRAIARDDERAARDQRRLLNRLRADLQTTYPAALALAGDDLGAPRCCGCCNVGPPRLSWRARRALSWSASPELAVTAGPNTSPIASAPH